MLATQRLDSITRRGTDGRLRPSPASSGSGRGAAPPSGPPRCPRCGAEHELDQEYCLECGLRLQPLGAPRQTIVRRELWSRESPAWLWATSSRSSWWRSSRAPSRPLPPRRTRTRTRAAGRDDGSRHDGDDRDVHGHVAARPDDVADGHDGDHHPDRHDPHGADDHDRDDRDHNDRRHNDDTVGPDPILAPGKDGYTIVLSSTPRHLADAPPAERKANQAIDAGSPEVGILNSSDFLTLNPGYYVVFTGIYDTLSQAQDALPTARSFEPLAYVREITP